MKIVYVAGAPIPSRAAHSIQVMRMAQAFAEAGHEVTLIIPSVAGVEQDVFGYYGVKPVFRIERQTKRRFKGGLLLWGLRAAMRARRLHPDLVYGRHVHACFFSALMGIPVTLEIHRPPTGSTSRALFSRLISLPSFRRVVTNSSALARILMREFPIPDGRIMAAPNGAEDPPTPPSLELGDQDRFRVGYVGHLYEGRGVELILEMARACSWADFHLVGGAPEDLERWRAKIDGLDNIVLHGFVPPSDVEAYRRGCDVLLAPYQREVLGTRDRDSSKYMSPLKLFEYMASGRAIVCADLPVLHEIVTDGDTAILCDPDRAVEWIETLQRLRRDADLRRRLGNRARAVFLHDFTRSARARKVLNGAQPRRVEESSQG